MSLTPNFGMNIPDASDIVNLLTQCYPNFTLLDGVLQAIKESGVTTASETKSGTTHQLVRSVPACSVLRFTATSNFVTGDSFTVDGTPVTAVAVNGTSLQTGDFVINSNVIGIVVGAVLTLFAGGNSAPDASDVTYDNTGSGLTANDVQAAIDENAGNIATNTNDIAANTAAIAAIVPGSKLSVLWTNPDPTQAMVSGDTITLSSSDYDALIVVAAAECNVANLICLSVVALKGYGFAMSYAILAGTHILETRRIFNYTSDTVITLNEGQTQQEGSARSTDNNRIVPMKVIGVKF